jgi:hypothetical protein
MKAFRQLVFPFGSVFLQSAEAEFEEILYGGNSTFTETVDQIIKQLGSVGEKILEYTSTIKEYDQFLMEGFFDDDYESLEPFFEWKNESYSEEIARLLSGEKVVFYANIYDSNMKKQAVKFKQINFRFKPANRKESYKVEEKMKPFMVDATHSGQSYFSFDKKIYLDVAAKVTITYSIELGDDKLPAMKNSVYDKIYRGDLMLSPYTMWEVQFKTKDPDSTIEFEDLNEFKHLVDLQMVGQGSYVQLSRDLPDFKVFDYYRNQLLEEY